MARVRKAVFPVAGMGTRFLSATKARHEVQHTFQFERIQQV